MDLVPQPLERHDGRGRAGARRRRREPVRRRPALLHAQGAPRPRPAPFYDRMAPLGDDPTQVAWDEARELVVERSRTSRRRRGHRRALLPRQLDRRAAARRQAAGRVLRDERPGRAPVRLHELHGRPPLGAHARARARARPARLPRRSRSASSTRRRRSRPPRPPPSSARRSRSSACSRSRRTRSAGSTCSPDGSRTRSRPSSARSR